MYACVNGVSVDVVRVLVENGADVNAKSKQVSMIINI